MTGAWDGVAKSRAAQRSLLAAAVGLALTACGGGGGGPLRPDPPPAGPPPTPPPTVVEPANPDFSDHITLTNAQPAIDAGLTGEGVRIGVIDSGVNRNHPSLAGRVVDNLIYVNRNTNDMSVDDKDGHGTAVAQIAAGTPFGQWPGGIAQGAEIVSARIINDEPPEDDGSGDGNEVGGALGLEPIHNDMIARGVKILNNSWGGLYWSNPAATSPIAAEYRRFIFEHDGLVVFAAGNGERDDPTDMAALPSQLGTGGSTPAAELEVGWLTVVALDGEDPSLLAEYSNACGVAMNYCLAAPGEVVFTGTDDAPDSPEYWVSAGTSFAAPQVSGAAALVWEAFPWFNNDLVRQTILGTAKDIGPDGVDEIFGYGLLDVGKAVQGPGRFDWGTVTANFSDQTSIWGNDIVGAGGLTKRGSGTLELSGDNTYRGATRIDGGTLHVSGSVAGSGVTIGSDGTLSGGGTVFGNVINQGTVLVNQGGASQADHFEITGNYTHANGATLALVLGHGPLVVAGDADIAGGSVHVAGVSDSYVTSDREHVLQVGGEMSGYFEALTYNADTLFLQANLAYDLQNVWLDIGRLDVHATVASMANATAASLSSAKRVENAFRELDGQQSGDGAVASGLIRAAGEFQRIADARMAHVSLASLSGELHAVASSTTFDAIDMSRRALSAQFASGANLVARPAAWARQLGGGGQGGFSGNEQAMDGWMIGRDVRLGNAIAGFAFGETTANSRREGSRDRGRDRQAQSLMYAGVAGNQAYALGQVGFGRFDRQLERHLFTGQRSMGVFSNYAGDFMTASLEAGYRLGDADAGFTPYLGAEYSRIRSDGFNELGGDGLGLRADAFSSSRSQAVAGLRGERQWLSGLRLQGYAEWQHTLSAQGLDLEAGFVGIDAWSPLMGLQPARSGGLFGLGLDAPVGSSGVVTLGYDQRFGPRGDARMVSLRYALGF
ncbi:S8 family serine peptidase [Luteimonas sp. MJ293]|uniref:S8 family serine peptidase n=1 Tax=Luteimonas sp. MJ146 TaxID=3129240 RepID=UPI0031B9CB1D